MYTDVQKALVHQMRHLFRMFATVRLIIGFMSFLWEFDILETLYS